VSVDLRHSRIVWQVPLGSTEGLTPWFVPSRDFGMPNMGGPIATDGDLVFVAATMDSYLRAFDIETGRELWRYKLPAGGQATPMTYRAGREPASISRHQRRRPRPARHAARRLRHRLRAAIRSGGAPIDLRR
jgi:glucose dehydrogenase